MPGEEAEDIAVEVEAAGTEEAVAAEEEEGVIETAMGTADSSIVGRWGGG